MATKTAKRTESKETGGDGQDAPVIDSTGAAVKKLLTRGKERGFVTYDELNSALPPEEVSSEQIEDTMTRLSGQGINLVVLGSLRVNYSGAHFCCYFCLCPWGASV